MELKNTRAGVLRRMQTGYRCFVPHPLQNIALEIGPELAQRTHEAYLRLGRLDGLASALPNVDLFVSMYVQKEAVISAQIEGTQASLVDVLQKDRNQQKIKDTEDVVNYIKAANAGFERMQELPLCLRLIKETHAVLLSNVRGSEKSPGEFRRTQNWIGPAGCTLNTASFVPPAPVEMEQALSDLEKFMHQESGMSDLVKAALIHYQFETIHPFLDGNGRMGRLLIIMFLKSQGLLSYPVLYLSYFFKKNQARYYALLNQVRFEGAFEAWIAFFMEGICEVTDNAITSIRQITALRQADQEKIRHAQNGKQANLLFAYEYLLEHPIVSSEDLVGALSLSKPTVNKILETSMDLGIVSLMEEKQRYKQYVYRAYVDILAEGAM